MGFRLSSFRAVEYRNAFYIVYFYAGIHTGEPVPERIDRLEWFRKESEFDIKSADYTICFKVAAGHIETTGKQPSRFQYPPCLIKGNGFQFH